MKNKDIIVHSYCSNNSKKNSGSLPVSDNQETTSPSRINLESRGQEKEEREIEERQKNKDHSHHKLEKKNTGQKNDKKKKKKQVCSQKKVQSIEVNLDRKSKCIYDDSEQVSYSDGLEYSDIGVLEDSNQSSN